MDLQTIFTIVMLTIFVAFTIGISLYFRNHMNLQKERLNLERRNQDIEYEMRREEMYNYRTKKKDGESETRYLPRLMEEIPYMIEKAINKSQKIDYSELSKMIDYNFQNINNKIKDINTTEEINVNSKQLIKEISHSLNTPFSLIEVTASNILDDNKTPSHIAESLKTIKSSVNICKSFLASFRELTLIASSSAIWNPESLVTAIESAINVYKHKSGKTNKTLINLPEDIDGFSNNYILSLLLPLIENAIEAAVSKSYIKVYYVKTENTINLSVTSTPKKLPESDIIYDDGFTTKDSHDGLGLSIVKHLLESQSDSKLEYKVSETEISFIITLIGRK